MIEIISAVIMIGVMVWIFANAHNRLKQIRYDTRHQTDATSDRRLSSRETEEAYQRGYVGSTTIPYGQHMGLEGDDRIRQYCYRKYTTNITNNIRYGGTNIDICNDNDNDRIRYEKEISN